MDWIKVFQMIGITSGISIIILFIIGYFAKIIFNSLIERDVENFKAQLQLSITEHRIKFFKLHSDRAETIRELYSRLVDLELLMKP